MAFELNSIVPWGRNKEEYRQMFALSNSDLNLKIASFGDGPASFNAEMNKTGRKVTSFDPIYGFEQIQLERRIEVTKQIVLEQTSLNMSNFKWTKIKSLSHLEELRLGAMKVFLEDFEQGKEEGRYVEHELPNEIDVNSSTFDLALSSHFLLLYDKLGLDFHIKAISEIMRVSNELRIFPILNLDIEISKVLEGVSKTYNCKLKTVDYEFQKGANKMLIIKN